KCDAEESSVAVLKNSLGIAGINDSAKPSISIFFLNVENKLKVKNTIPFRLVQAVEIAADGFKGDKTAAFLEQTQEGGGSTQAPIEFGTFNLFDLRFSQPIAGITAGPKPDSPKDGDILTSEWYLTVGLLT